MGFFGNRYTRPGPGVSKEQAAKRNYFEMFGRKFWKLVQLNLLYFVCTLPFTLLTIFLWIGYTGLSLESFTQFLDNFVALAQAGTPWVPILPFLPMMLTGPFTAGLTYVLRNYARQEHAFMASDFFEHTKKNWKQGLLASILGGVVLYAVIFSYFFYITRINPTILLAITVVVSLVLISMTYYVFPMMVTFNMKFRHILKNAWIFAIAKFPQNLFLTVVIFGVHILLIWCVSPLWILLMILILISWSGFTMNYYVWHVMNKYMIKESPVDVDAAHENVFDDTTIDHKKK